MKKITQNLILSLFALVMIGIYVPTINAQVLISNGQTVTQDFDGIGVDATAALPAGWKIDKNTDVRTVGTYTNATTATERRAGNSMSGTAANGIYNYGAGDAATATDRAVGWISSASATKSGNLYLMLENDGAANINYLTISYDVEKYRNGTNVAGFSIQMYYSLDGILWTDAGADFLTSFAGGNAANEGFASAPGETLAVGNKNLNVIIPAGGTIYLAWNYSVTSGTTTSNSQGLGVDNIAIEAAALSTADDATLSSLSSSLGILSPAFNPGVYGYTALLPYGTTATPTVTAIPSASGATVTITPAADVTSAIAADRTTVIEVESEDQTETNTYTVEFNVPTLASDDASLSAITTSVGSLSPSFSSSVHYYTVQLPYGITATPTVTATPTHPFAVATVTPATDVNSTDSLERTTTIEVLAEDGIATETYVVQFNPTILTVVDVADVAALRNGATDGTLYRLTGEAVLTYKQNYRNQKFIQDATAGIMIDDFANVMNTPYDIGDGITDLIGTLEVYNNMLQIIPVVNPGTSSVNNIIVAEAKTVSQISSSDQAKLLKIMNANFPAGVDTFKVNTSYNLTDATGTIVFRTAFHQADYIGTVVPTYTVNVTGILHQYINTLNFSSRDLADIEQSTSTNIMLSSFAFKAYPNPSTDYINFAFELAAPQHIVLSIYDISGKEVFSYTESKNAGQHTISWQKPAAQADGIYLYSFKTETDTKQGKLIFTR